MGACSSSTPEGGARKPSTIPVVVQENSHGRFSDISGVEKSTGVYRTSPLLDAMADEDLEVTELSALKQIQKSVRRTRALKKAKNDAHWTFFAQVDTLEENETLTMASFLQNLIALVPGADAGSEDPQGSEEVANKEGDDREVAYADTSEILLEEIVLEDHEEHHTKIIVTDHRHGELKLISYRGAMNPQKARELIGMLRGDTPARLDLDTLRKLMRNVYKRLKLLENFNRVEVPAEGKVTVVGDIHGQLEDLLLILEDAGEPSENNLFIFNGDFVDRGANSCEVISILFALYAAFPGCVYLNRGNHEDTFICQQYGFQEEVVHKYDLETFFMFGETFKHLPLFSVVSDSVFVVHGGLFCDANATLKDLEQINRLNFEAVPPEKFPGNTVGKSDEVYREELLKQFQRDALWSDPRSENGLAANHRGAGVTFGPDHAATFMSSNKLSMVIRSHEMCPHGIDFPYAIRHIIDEYLDLTDSCVAPDGDDPAQISVLEQNIPVGGEPLLCTLFSASNYCDGDNEGAFLVLRRKAEHLPTPTYANEVGDTHIYFTTHRYRATHRKAGSLKDERSSFYRLQAKNKQTCMDLLLRKKRALTMAFRSEDKEQTETISAETWAKVMAQVSGLKIRWLGLLSSVVPAGAREGGKVHYKIFLANIRRHAIEGPTGKGDGKGTGKGGGREGERGAGGGAEDSSIHTSSQVMDALYGNKKRVIEKIFYYFDTDNDGVISATEFRAGCAKLNNSLQPGDPRTLTDIDHALATMDFDHSGAVDINEFFECFRILNRFQQTHDTPGGSETP